MKTTGFIILAGGKSSRMGSPKEKLDWEGKSFLEALVEKAKTMGFEEIYISSNQGIEGYRTIADTYRDAGPVSGIYSCLLESRCGKNVVLPVDLPQAPCETIMDMVSMAYRTDADCVMLSCGGFIEPLFSVFDRRVAPVLEEMLKEGSPSVKAAARRINTEYCYYRGPSNLIKSMNTREEYTQMFEKYGKTDSL